MSLTADSPFGAWPFARRLRWGVVAALAAVVLLPSTIDHLRPNPQALHDFYQEWSSARNALDGHPVYEPVPDSAHRYLGIPNDLPGWTGTVNVHPPSSLLVGLPLARLDYPDALLVWNLVSLGLLVISLRWIVRGLALRTSGWDWLAVAVVLLAGYPLAVQIFHGQLSLLLLFLVTASWYADRRGIAWAAGAALAAAAAAKLFPAYLGLYFLLRRRFGVLGYAALCLVLLSALTAAFAGWGVFGSYARDVLPHSEAWLAAVNNASLSGFWHRLFGAGGHYALNVPLVESPLTARLASAVCALAVSGVTAAAVWRVRSPSGEIHAFALVLVASLLVSPVTWEHSFLLLPLPLLVLWLGDPRRRLRWRGVALLAAIAVLSIPTLSLFQATLPGGLRTRSGTPLHSVTLCSLQLYTLLALWIALVRACYTPARTQAVPPEPTARRRCS